MKRVLQLMTVVLLGVMFSSCRDYYDRYYDAPFLGTWISVGYDDGYHTFDVRPYDDDYHRYVFYDDGTGVYTDYRGRSTRFYWDAYGRNEIRLRHEDGYRETYYYDFDHRYLLLSEYYDFRTYYIYD